METVNWLLGQREKIIEQKEWSCFVSVKEELGRLQEQPPTIALRYCKVCTKPRAAPHSWVHSCVHKSCCSCSASFSSLFPTSTHSCTNSIILLNRPPAAKLQPMHCMRSPALADQFLWSKKAKDVKTISSLTFHPSHSASASFIPWAHHFLLSRANGAAAL